MNVFLRSEIYLAIDKMQKLMSGNSQALLLCWTLVRMATDLHHHLHH